MSCCSSRGLRFDSQHLRSRPQPSFTPVPWYPRSSSVLCRCQACTEYTNIHVGKTVIHINNAGGGDDDDNDDGDDGGDDDY